MKISPTVWFSFFAISIATRDIAFDLFISKNYHPVVFSLALLASTSFFGLSFLILSNEKSSIKTIKEPRFIFLCLGIGALAAYLYGTAFILIKNVSAGMFNLIDYGFTPIFTLIIGFLYFKEKLDRLLIPIIILFFFGMLMVHSGKPTDSIISVGVILTLPIGTAISDAITKILLSDYKISRNQLIVLRFLPASLIIFIVSHKINATPKLDLNSTLELLTYGFLFGYLPILFLFKGLKEGKLSSLSMTEFSIPIISLIFTLPFNLDSYGRPIQLLGITLMIIVIFLCSRILKND